MGKNEWVKEIQIAIQILGGEATLVDIYAIVEKRKEIDLSHYVDWQSRIRTYIYKHSSDTEIFTGNFNDETDIFYSVEGKGKGIWGLRKFKVVK